MEILPPRRKFGSTLKPTPMRESSPVEKDPWLDRAREAFDTSTTFYQTNYRKTWDDSIRHFQNRHMAGSKYYSNTYKYRSRSFRPKTRATVRNVEAATGAAFFSQLDVISVEPEDDQDPMQLAGSALRQELINYRLSGKDQIPWYLICVGAMQDAQVIGVVASKQFWDFEEKVKDIEIEGVLDQEGNQATTKQRTTIKDRPDIKLYPIENIRFDPAAEWTDVVNTSPYFIGMESMRIGTVRQKIKDGIWKKLEDDVLLAARNNYYDSTRQERVDKKEDDKDPRHSKDLSDFDLVWVHENFMMLDGEDHHYYTLSTVALLSEVRPLEEVYLHGRRPFVVGTCVIETHKSLPDSPVHLAKSVQKEANEISNTRLDNVKLVLNKRWLVKRGKQVDLQSLVRNAPASVTLVNDMDDAQPIDFTDVTGSSYAEQDRINVDMDELLGSFSAGSVATNRKLGETVGGLQMLRGTANSMGQYIIRVFSETWVEKVLNHLDELEQYYESDMNLLTTLAKRANLQKYEVQFINKDLLMAPGRVSINVANSAQDPTVRLELFTYAMRTYAEFRQMMPPDIDPEPVKSYIFGLLGFRDAKRFSVDTENQDPRLMEMEQQIQQLSAALEDKMAEIQAKNEAKMMEVQAKMLDNREARLMEMEQNERDNQTKTLIADMNNATKLLVEQFKDEMGQDSNETQMAIQELDQRTQEIIQTVSDTSQGDAIRELVSQMSEGFKALAESGSKDNTSEIISTLNENNKAIMELAKTMGSPRENEIIERDAEGIPTRTRSRIVNG